MFEELKIFEVREPVDEDYQVPAVDVASSTATAPAQLLPAPPVVLGINSSGITWVNETNATSWQVESIGSGGIWYVVQGDIPASVPTQIVWDGYFWHIQAYLGTAWEDQYVSSNEDYLARNPWEVVTWVDVNSVGGGLPVVVQNDPIASGGVLVSGAEVSAVNCFYALDGDRDGDNFYSGPSLVTYSFSPTNGSSYRVRGLNAAGPGGPSNVVIYSNALYDCAGNPSTVAGLVWSIGGVGENTNDNADSVGAASASGASGNYSTSVTLTSTRNSGNLDYGDLNFSVTVSLSATLCNPTAQNLYLKVSLSDIVFQNVDSSDTEAYCNSGVTITINGTQTTLYYVNSGIDDTGPEIIYAGPLYFLVPAQSLTTIVFNATSQRTVGILGDVASTSGNFALELTDESS